MLMIQALFTVVIGDCDVFICRIQVFQLSVLVCTASLYTWSTTMSSELTVPVSMVTSPAPEIC